MDLNPMKDLPMGFGMALVQNEKAMSNFANMTENQRKSIINQTHSISSKEEMQSFVNNLAKQITD